MSNINRDYDFSQVWADVQTSQDKVCAANVFTYVTLLETNPEEARDYFLSLGLTDQEQIDFTLPFVVLDNKGSYVINPLDVTSEQFVQTPVAGAFSEALHEYLTVTKNKLTLNLAPIIEDLKDESEQTPDSEEHTDPSEYLGLTEEEFLSSLPEEFVLSISFKEGGCAEVVSNKEMAIKLFNTFPVEDAVLTDMDGCEIDMFIA